MKRANRVRAAIAKRRGLTQSINTTYVRCYVTTHTSSDSNSNMSSNSSNSNKNSVTNNMNGSSVSEGSGQGQADAKLWRRRGWRPKGVVGGWHEALRVKKMKEEREYQIMNPVVLAWSR